MHYHISEPAANLIRGRRCGNELNNPAERPLIFYFAKGSDPVRGAAGAAQGLGRRRPPGLSAAACRLRSAAK